MYSVGLYGEMIGDTIRMRAYTQALRDAVKPGSVVLDIGTGTGIFAMLAAQFGARRVYAIEPADAIQVAREIAAASGCADRIEFIQDISTKVSLPERADVIVSDLRGVLPLYERHIPSIVDARERFLAPEGRLIPLRDDLGAAVVESPARYDAPRSLGVTTPRAGHGARTPVRHHSLGPGERQPGRSCSAADLGHAGLRAHRERRREWRSELDRGEGRYGRWPARLVRRGVARGREFTNAPGEPELIYGSAFFPFSQPVALDVGDNVTVTIRADLVGGDYVWRWNTVVVAPGSPERTRRRSSSRRFTAPLCRRRICAGPAPPTFPVGRGRGGRSPRPVADGRGQLAGNDREAAGGAVPRPLRQLEDALNHVSELSKTYSRRPGRCAIGLKDPQSMSWS